MISLFTSLICKMYVFEIISLLSSNLGIHLTVLSPLFYRYLYCLSCDHCLDVLSHLSTDVCPFPLVVFPPPCLIFSAPSVYRYPPIVSFPFVCLICLSSELSFVYMSVYIYIMSVCPNFIACLSVCLSVSLPFLSVSPVYLSNLSDCPVGTVYVQGTVCQAVWLFVSVCPFHLTRIPVWLLSCLSVSPSVCLFVFLSVYVFRHVGTGTYLFVFMSVIMYLCLSVCIFVCLSVCLSICLSVCLSVCLCVSTNTNL